MNIPDINEANMSLKINLSTAYAVSQADTASIQHQPERNDEYVKQARKTQSRISERETRIAINEEQSDKFIQSQDISNAVYNVKDISHSDRGGSENRLDEEKKVLDIVLPVGRKRLRIFLEE